MKKAFEKYFLSLVFILISGFALLHGNSLFDGNYDLDKVEETHFSDISDAERQLYTNPGNNSGLEKTFFELTESEELDLLSKGAKKNFLLLTGSVFAIFFYAFNWNVNLKSSLLSSFSTSAIRLGLSKRYIQFEVFRV